MRSFVPMLKKSTSFARMSAEMAALAPNEVERLCLVASAGLWLDQHPLPDLFALLPQEFPGYLFHDVERGSISASPLPEQQGDGLHVAWHCFMLRALGAGVKPGGRALWRGQGPGQIVGASLALRDDDPQRDTLTPERWQRLEALFIRASEGRATVGGLTRSLQLGQAGVTQLVRRAENLGLVRRELSQTDARVRFLRLTPEGERVSHPDFAVGFTAEQIRGFYRDIGLEWAD